MQSSLARNVRSLGEWLYRKQTSPPNGVENSHPVSHIHQGAAAVSHGVILSCPTNYPLCGTTPASPPSTSPRSGPLEAITRDNHGHSVTATRLNGPQRAAIVAAPFCFVRQSRYPARGQRHGVCTNAPKRRTFQPTFSGPGVRGQTNHGRPQRALLTPSRPVLTATDYG